MGENNFTKWPVAFYRSILFMNGVAYSILSRILIKESVKNSKLAQAYGKDKKGNLSILLYSIAIRLAFINTKISLGIYAAIAVTWFIPDTRIERVLLKKEE